MATSIAGNSIWLYQIEYRRAGQRMLTTQTMQIDGIGSIADYQAAGLAFLVEQEVIGNVLRLIRAQLPTAAVILSHSVQPIYPLRFAPVKRALTLYQGENAGGDALPPNVAATITKRSISATRWGIGSAHLPVGTTFDYTVNGVWTALFLASLQAIADRWAMPWFTTPGGEVWYPVLWTRGSAVRISRIVAAQAQDTVRVERRRTVGVGQ